MVSLVTPHALNPKDLPAWPIVGHEWAVRFLDQLTATVIGPAADAPRARNSSLRHAYLLLGPAHVGKSTLAHLFAQAILCNAPATRPCGTCRACTLMARGIHPDFRLIQPTDKDGAVDRVNGLLRAEAANEIVHDAALHPVEAQYKVFLIQDAHRANPAFANKLLKTLEEPPPNVILCLTAVDRQQLLPTIVSRCQALELRPTAREQIQRALVEQHGVEPARADLLARLANGRMGWAANQLTAAADNTRLEQLELLWRLTAAGNAQRLDWAEKAASNRNSDHLFGMLELWVNWWRDILLYQSGCGDACNNIDQQARIAVYAESVAQADIRAYLQTIQRVERYLHHTVNTRLALDVLALRLPHVPDSS
ncbi:MAG: DNA polymerase III subunit delta' C-terminal domain-containing protein [Litorilinea sp.]